MKKYTFLLVSLSLLAGCTCQPRDFAPKHFGVTPSVEWEVQDGAKTKTKPKIQTSLDWNF